MLSQHEEFRELEKLILQYDHAVRAGQLTSEKVLKAQHFLDGLAKKYQHNPHTGVEKFRLYEFQALIVLSQGEELRAADFLQEAISLMRPQDHFVSSVINSFACQYGVAPKIKKLVGIKGWLWIYAFGFVVTPFILIYDLVVGLLYLQDVSVSQNADLSLYFNVAALLDIFQLVAVVLIAIPFFKKEKIARPLMAGYLIANALVYLIFAVWLGIICTHYSVPEGEKVVGEVGRTIIITILWLNYWVLSKRVKNTFIK